MNIFTTEHITHTRLIPQYLNWELVQNLENKSEIFDIWPNYKPVDCHNESCLWLTLKPNNIFILLFQLQGLIMQYETPALDEKNHVCIDPKQLAHATCLFHFDDLTKNFKFEAYRFWPKDSGYNRPDPSVLVRALEEIPSSGVIREALFPLLWQVYIFTAELIHSITNLSLGTCVLEKKRSYSSLWKEKIILYHRQYWYDICFYLKDKQYSEEQIKLIISILTERNLIYKESQSNTPELASAENYDIHHVGDKDLFLPNYPGLSPTTKYYLPLLGSLSDIKPVSPSCFACEYNHLWALLSEQSDIRFMNIFLIFIQGVNWSEELFEDDIHFGLVFTLQNQEVTESLVKKMLVSCNECSQGQSYKYLWNRGCLCKYNDEVR